MADDDDGPQWAGLTREDREKLLKHPGIQAKLVSIAQQLAASANRMAEQYNRPDEAGRDNFGVYVSPSHQSFTATENAPTAEAFKSGSGGSGHVTRARAYVHPLGRTGIHVEQGESVLLKAIAGLPKQ